ncbi:MAG: hypothetical protein AB1Z67_07425 [Candidatus Limnocylindrales bacterium]
MGTELGELGFLHLGRPESGVRRYGQLIADEARTRDGLHVTEVEAGRVDESSEQLARVAAGLAGTDVVLMQWNRRGWGKNGRALPRLMRFRRTYKGALVVTLHDIFDREGFRARYLDPDVWGLRQLGRTADIIVVHSQIEVERMRGIVPVEKLRVIPHFVESRELPMSPAEARAKLGIGERKLVTLLGFVYGRKGHRYAFQAVPYMPDDAMMVYAGGPIEGRTFVYDFALRKARKLGLGDRFRITGYLSEEEMGTWMAATHLAILPFTDLSASGSMSSWISSGKPMLVSDLPGTREYARRVPGALNFFGPAGEPWPLGSAISELLAKPLLDPDPGVRKLAEELSMSKTVDRYLEVAREALAGR